MKVRVRLLQNFTRPLGVADEEGALDDNKVTLTYRLGVYIGTAAVSWFDRLLLFEERKSNVRRNPSKKTLT